MTLPLRAAVLALCVLLSSGAAALAQSEGAWRFLDGPGAIGVMRVAPNATTQEGLSAIGLFMLRVADRGLFEGVYNLRDDGRSVVGMFWPEGKLNDGPVAGFLDIDADGQGTASFISDGGSAALSAR